MSKTPTIDFKIIDEIPTNINPQQITNSSQGNRSSKNQSSLRKSAHKPSVSVIEELSLEDESSIESEDQQVSKGSSFQRNRHGSKQSTSSNSNASGKINNVRSSQQSNKYPRTPRNSISVPTVHQSRGISNSDSTVNASQQNGRLSRNDTGSRLSSHSITTQGTSFVFVSGQEQDNFAFSGSREPSMRANSVISLPVIREQYCCFQRWTRTERTLMKAIGILAGVIIGLAIAVILLAYHREHEDKKHLQMGRATSARFMWTL